MATAPSPSLTALTDCRSSSVKFTDVQLRETGCSCDLRHYSMSLFPVRRGGVSCDEALGSLLDSPSVLWTAPMFRTNCVFCGFPLLIRRPGSTDGFSKVCEHVERRERASVSVCQTAAVSAKDTRVKPDRKRMVSAAAAQAAGEP